MRLIGYSFWSESRLCVSALCVCVCVCVTRGSKWIKVFQVQSQIHSNNTWTDRPMGPTTNLTEWHTHRCKWIAVCVYRTAKFSRWSCQLTAYFTTNSGVLCARVCVCVFFSFFLLFCCIVSPTAHSHWFTVHTLEQLILFLKQAQSFFSLLSPLTNSNSQKSK